MFSEDEYRLLADLNRLLTRVLDAQDPAEHETELRAALAAAARIQASAQQGSAGENSRYDQLMEYLQRFLFATSGVLNVPKALQGDTRLEEAHAAILSLRRFTLLLSKGDLSEDLAGKGYLAGALKMLQANLRHLTWQTQQIAAGDYNQRVDFMGEYARAFNSMISRLRETVGALRERQHELRKVIEALDKEIEEHKEALARVRQLQGLLPICSYCKKIRDDQNYWQQVESYISRHSEAQFSHGICPDCYGKVAKKWDLAPRNAHDQAESGKPETDE